MAMAMACRAVGLTGVRGRQAGARSAVRAQGFFGSPENLAVCTGTTIFLIAGRFGLAPSANRLVNGTNRLQLEENESGLNSGDPANFTAVDVLAYGSFGHAVAIGMVLGLKAQGKL